MASLESTATNAMTIRLNDRERRQGGQILHLIPSQLCHTVNIVCNSYACKQRYFLQLFKVKKVILKFKTIGLLFPSSVNLLELGSEVQEDIDESVFLSSISL